MTTKPGIPAFLLSWRCVAANVLRVCKREHKSIHTTFSLTLCLRMRMRMRRPNPPCCQTVGNAEFLCGIFCSSCMLWSRSSELSRKLHLLAGYNIGGVRATGLGKQETGAAGQGTTGNRTEKKRGNTGAGCPGGSR